MAEAQPQNQSQQQATVSGAPVLTSAASILGTQLDVGSEDTVAVVPRGSRLGTKGSTAASRVWQIFGSVLTLREGRHPNYEL